MGDDKRWWSLSLSVSLSLSLSLSHVRANTQHTTRSVEGRGMEWGTWGKQDEPQMTGNIREAKHGI